MSLPAFVTVVEVGPRDGLQNESAELAVDDKVAFCDALVGRRPARRRGRGVRLAEVGAADGGLRRGTAARVRKPEGVRLPVLVPNRQGYERARAAGAREIAVFTAASETFSRKNTNASIDESFERFAAFVPEARREGLRVRGYVSTVFGCPYEGAVDPARATSVVARLADAGCDEVSIGDTIGVAVPTQVSDLLGRLTERLPLDRVAVHFHDTRGTALANVLAALEQGVAVVDSAAGGTGGCPYAPGASGNLATEDLLYMLQGMGIETGVDIGAVAAASRALAAKLGRSLPSRYLQAGPPRRSAS
jgi:hydroxymethylglutaryl-CoA lyase